MRRGRHLAGVHRLSYCETLRQPADDLTETESWPGVFVLRPIFAECSPEKVRDVGHVEKMLCGRFSSRAGPRALCSSCGAYLEKRLSNFFFGFSVPVGDPAVR